MQSVTIHTKRPTRVLVCLWVFALCCMRDYSERKAQTLHHLQKKRY
jgi:hypothetical protein